MAWAHCVGFQNLAALHSVLALLLQTCFVLGTIKSIGVFLPELEVKLGLTSTDIGLALGLFDAFAFGPGPVVAYLYQRLHGCYRRLLLMTGAFLAPGSLVLGSLVTNNFELAACLSAAGLGSNILSISLVITLSDQCSDEFGILYGIGKSGYAFGMALMPLLADFLMGVYGWSGSLMIIGGIMAHLIPLTLMVDINAGQVLKDTPRSTNSGSREHHGPFDTNDGDSKISDTTFLEEPSVRQQDKVGADGSHDHGKLVSNICSGTDNDGLDAGDEETAHDTKRLLETSCTDERHKEVPDVSRKHKKTLRLMNCSELYSNACCILRNSVFNRDRWLILLLFVTLVFAMFDGGWHAFLIPRAVGRGIPTARALSLAYSAAAAAFIGRCFGGLLLKSKILSGQCWFIFLTFLNITSLLVDIFVPKFAFMIVTSFITSLTVAERNILILVLCKDRAPQSAFPLILASSEILFGLGTFLGASLSGLVADVTGSFNASFMFIAAVDAFVLCLMIPPTIAERRSDISV